VSRAKDTSDLQGARDRAGLLEHRADDALDLDQQLLGEGVRVVDRPLGLPAGDVSRELELKVQGG